MNLSKGHISVKEKVSSILTTTVSTWKPLQMLLLINQQLHIFRRTNSSTGYASAKKPFPNSNPSMWTSNLRKPSSHNHQERPHHTHPAPPQISKNALISNYHSEPRRKTYHPSPSPTLYPPTTIESVKLWRATIFGNLAFAKVEQHRPKRGIVVVRNAGGKNRGLEKEKRKGGRRRRRAPLWRFVDRRIPTSSFLRIGELRRGSVVLGWWPSPSPVFRPRSTRFLSTLGCAPEQPSRARTSRPPTKPSHGAEPRLRTIDSHGNEPRSRSRVEGRRRRASEGWRASCRLVQGRRLQPGHPARARGKTSNGHGPDQPSCIPCRTNPHSLALCHPKSGFWLNLVYRGRIFFV